MQTLIKNATVITVDPTRRVIPNGALVIRGDRIVDIGPSDEVEQFNPSVDRVIDATNRVVMPGFVSTHNHLGYSIFRGRAEDIGHVAVQGLYVPMSTILTRDERAVMASLSTAELLRGGVTTVLQMEEDADITAPFVEKIGMRALMGIMAHDIKVEAMNREEIIFDEAVREAQLQQSIDFAESIHGKGNGRLQAVFAANTASTSSPALLRTLRDTADRMNVRVSMHMGIGEADEVEQVHGARVFPYCHDNGFLDERAIAVHCYKVDEQDVSLLGRSGASLAHCPLMNQFRGCIAPMEDMRAQGVQVGLGIDNYFSDHFDVMRACVAVARIRADDPKAVLSEDVLALATIDAAKVMGLDSEIGSLEVGKKADLQIIDTRRYGLSPINDPVRTLVYHGHAKDVEMVMVDGRVVVEDGRVLDAEEDTLIEEAAKAGGAVWQRFAERHGGYSAR